MELGRRAFFFSFISLMILLGLFFLAEPRPYEATVTRVQANQDRIAFTNAIIQDFEQAYLSEAVQSQSVIVFQALSGYLESRGSLFTSAAQLESNFTEGLINGTFDGGKVSVASELPAGYGGAQRDLIKLLGAYANASGQNYNLRFSFAQNPSDYKVKLYQDNGTGPWQVAVELSIPYNVTPGISIDGKQIANWTLNHSIITYVNIKGITDPYLLVRSDGNISEPIREFYTQVWTRPTFVAFVHNGSYYASNGSLSFLGRYFESTEYSSCCGIVTTINRTKFEEYYPPTLDSSRFENISFFDCGYFPNSAVTRWCRRGSDRLVYAVKDISNYTLDASGAISNPTSSFPFTVPGGVAGHTFNLTVRTDMYDVQSALHS